MDFGGALAAGLDAGTNAAQGVPPPVAGVGGPMPPSPATPAAAAPVPLAAATDAQAAPTAGGPGSGINEAPQAEEEMTEDELVAEAIRRSMEDI